MTAMTALAPLAMVPDVVPLAGKRWRMFRKQTSAVGAYTLHDEVGEGGFGKVHLGSVAKRLEAKVAIKQMDGKRGTGALRNEAKVQVACHDHPNIATCHDLLRTRTKCFLVMEFATQGDLFNRVRNHGPLPPAAVALVMKQLASALAHMHAKGFVHRDVKPENVLLTGEGGEAKALLCDFGHATAWTEKDGLLSESCGTVRCLPPEMFLLDTASSKRRYDPRLVDAFGLGTVLFYVLTGRFPFDGPTPADTARSIAQGRPTTPFPKDISKECSDLLLGLLEWHPNDRLTVQEALAHPFLAPHSGRQGSG